MSKLRDLIKELPKISECRDPERFSLRNKVIFDLEKDDNEIETFAFKESDIDGERLAVLEIPGQYIGNQKAYDAGMKRIKISMLSQDKSKGRISEEGEKQLEVYIEETKTSLEANDPDELAVEAVLPLEVAAQGVWF